MTKSMKIMLLCSTLVFGGIFVFFGVKSYFIKQFMSTFKMPPATVSAMNVPSEPWQAKLQATASLAAVNGVSVTTEIAGQVKAINFSSGAEVKKGNLLVELNADAEIAQLHALEAQAELALITYDRNKKQLESKAISKAEVDIAEADLKSKRAQVAQQAATVAKKTIRAPFDGRLGLSNIDLGQYINPGDKIVTLQSINPMLVHFSIPQQQVPQLVVAQEIVLKTDTFPGEVFKGKITAISPLIDSATRNVEVEATVPNLKGNLSPGMFGFVEINTGPLKDVLTLPQAAITYNPYGDLVYLLKEDSKDEKDVPIYKAEQKFVSLGETRGDQVQVISGLEKNDLVVTSGQMKLKNGSLVKINNEVVPGNNPNPELKKH